MTATFQTVETAAFFAVLIGLLECGACVLVSGWDRLWLVGQAPFMGLALWIVHAAAVRETRIEKESSGCLQERQEFLARLNKEKEALTRRVSDLGEQAALRRHLFDAVQQMASLLDPLVIRQRLMEFVRSTVRKGTIQFGGLCAARSARQMGDGTQNFFALGHRHRAGRALQDGALAE